MTDKYEEFKEWFKHHPTDEDEIDLVFAIGNLFKSYEEYYNEKQYKDEIINLINRTLMANLTYIEYSTPIHPAQAIYEALKEKDMIK